MDGFPIRDLPPVTPLALDAVRVRPSTSSLRLARQFRAQGRYSPRPGTACRGIGAVRTGDRRGVATTRLAPALSLLRRTHAHHRDLRTLDAAARAAPGSHSNRVAVMTRHGKRSPRAETPLVPAIAICAPFASSVTRDLNLAGDQFPIQRPPNAKSHSPRPRRRHRRPDAAIITTRAKPQIPIDRCRTHAGSCLGGFRTPNGIRKPSPFLPFKSVL